jgi:hypothetical protein
LGEIELNLTETSNKAEIAKRKKSRCGELTANLPPEFIFPAFNYIDASQAVMIFSDRDGQTEESAGQRPIGGGHHYLSKAVLSNNKHH